MKNLLSNKAKKLLTINRNRRQVSPHLTLRSHYKLEQTKKLLFMQRGMWRQFPRAVQLSCAFQ